MLPFKSLDAVTTTGPGAACDLETVAKDFTIAPSFVTNDGQVQLEGSLDGENWLALTSPSTGWATASSHYVRFVRANLTTIGSGGVITAWIAAKVDCDG